MPRKTKEKIGEKDEKKTVVKLKKEKKVKAEKTEKEIPKQAAEKKEIKTEEKAVEQKNVHETKAVHEIKKTEPPKQSAHEEKTIETKIAPEIKKEIQKPIEKEIKKVEIQKEIRPEEKISHGKKTFEKEIEEKEKTAKHSDPTYEIVEKEPEQPEANIGMIGHVDHGKTSLTEKLTGKWTDTHSEEIKQGISIRLGYADITFRKCPACKEGEAFTNKKICPNCKTKTKVIRRVSFVDAPGHETLMTTMLSGAALMDGAILVIAANEICPQPRTIEHLMALSVSEIKKIVVAQNKVDLVEREKAIENYNQIKAFLKEQGFENVPIIPVSANFGVNIDLLMQALNENIPTPERNTNADPEMFIVRSFDVNKPGAKPNTLVGGVMGGTLKQGTLKKNSEIEIVPGLNNAPIRTKLIDLNSSNAKLESAKPGGLIALSTLLDPELTRNDRMRGQLIGLPGKMPKAVTEIKIEFKEFKRLVDSFNSSDLQVNEVIMLTIGTAINAGIIKLKKHGLIDISLRQPGIARKNERIAISRKTNSGWRLSGYGIIK